MAYHATHQVEGAAAVRYRVPQARGASGGSLRDVEVVWENLLDGQHERAILPDAGSSLPCRSATRMVPPSCVAARRSVKPTG